MRMSSGSSYDAATATVIGNFPSGTTSFATTDGLESPGDEASFKLFVVLTTGNEAGSNTVTIARPEFRRVCRVFETHRDRGGGAGCGAFRRLNALYPATRLQNSKCNLGKRDAYPTSLEAISSCLPFWAVFL